MGIERKTTITRVVHHHQATLRESNRALMSAAEVVVRQLHAAENHRENLLRQYTEQLNHAETPAEKSAILCHLAHTHLLQRNPRAALADFNAAEAFHSPLRTTAYLERAAIHYHAANLAKADLAKADLAEADLAEADLAEADLAKADLAKADLAKAYLAKADLAKAYLAKAERDMTQALDQLKFNEYPPINRIAVLYAMKKNQTLIDSNASIPTIAERLRTAIDAFEQQVPAVLRHPSASITATQMAIAPSVVTTHYHLTDLTHDLHNMRANFN